MTKQTHSCPMIASTSRVPSLGFSENPQSLKAQINGFYAKKPLTHAHSSLLPFSHHRHLLSHIIPFLCLSAQAQQPNEVPFIADYLISSFGFPADRALRLAATPRLRPIKSRDRPDSVVNFLKEIGFSDAQVKTVISRHPQLLSCGVDVVLKPRAAELLSNGFSKETIMELILHSPSALSYKPALSRLQFWRNFAGKDEKALLKVIRANFNLFNHDVDKKIIPNIDLLKEYGMSDQHVMLVITRVNTLISQNPETIKKLLKETEELGFERGSGLFIEGLLLLGRWRRETIERKMEFFKKIYGWSDKDVNIVVRKCPSLFGLSEENIKNKMDFLIKKAGFDREYIVSRPVLLKHSLEGKLVPRHHVLTLLKEKGVKIKSSFFTVCNLSEKRFCEQFILAYENQIPDIQNDYDASFAVKEFD